MIVVSYLQAFEVYRFNKHILVLPCIRDLKLYIFILASKIEVRLKGQSSDSFSYKQDASHAINSNNLNSPLKADFLTFATLRPISTLGPFIKHLSAKHIGVIVGEYY